MYYSGDEVKISFWATKDSFVQIIVVDEDKNATLLYPNKYMTNNQIKAGEVFNFPDENNEAGNLQIKAVLPAGKTESVELLQIILTKNEPLFSVSETKETTNSGYKQFSLGELSQISSRLSKLDRSQWAMLVIPYGIKKR